MLPCVVVAALLPPLAALAIPAAMGLALIVTESMIERRTGETS
jgi:hypothetical protein